MQRTPEPELMEGQEQAFAYAAADFSVGDQALVDRLVQLFPAGLGTSVVDLGCGPGNISFRLARRWPQANVLGIDGAAAMLIRLPAAAHLGSPPAGGRSCGRAERHTHPWPDVNSCSWAPRPWEAPTSPAADRRRGAAPPAEPAAAAAAPS